MQLTEFMTAYRDSLDPDQRMLDGDAAAALDMVAEWAAESDADPSLPKLRTVLEGHLVEGQHSDGGALAASWLFGQNDAAEWGRRLQRALHAGEAPEREPFERWADGMYVPRVNAMFTAVEAFTEGQRFRLEHPEGYFGSDATVARLATLGGDRAALAAQDDAILESFARIAADASFHMVHRQTLVSWAQLLAWIRGEPAFPVEHTAKQVDSARVLLARHALSLTRLKRAFELPEWRRDASVSVARAAVNGVLAELDVAIALLPIMTRGEPGQFLLLAAPPQFEMRAGSANADFLVLDLVHRRARGVQVKSSSRAILNREYDLSRISVVYAADELGAFVPVSGATGEPRLHAPSPGTFSLRYLSTVNAYRTWVHGLDPADIEYSVRLAEQALPATVSDAGQRINGIASAGSATPSAAEHQRVVRRAKQATRRNHERASEDLIDRIFGEL